jgi:hypothetical protein
LTETVLLGIVAYRSASDVVWDAQKMLAVDNERAQGFVSKRYRKGFEVIGLEASS